MRPPTAPPRTTFAFTHVPHVYLRFTLHTAGFTCGFWIPTDHHTRVYSSHLCTWIWIAAFTWITPLVVLPFTFTTFVLLPLRVGPDFRSVPTCGYRTRSYLPRYTFGSALYRWVRFRSFTPRSCGLPHLDSWFPAGSPFTYTPHFRFTSSAVPSWVTFLVAAVTAHTPHTRSAVWFLRSVTTVYSSGLYTLHTVPRSVTRLLRFSSYIHTATHFCYPIRLRYTGSSYHHYLHVYLPHAYTTTTVCTTHVCTAPVHWFTVRSSFLFTGLPHTLAHCAPHARVYGPFTPPAGFTVCRDHWFPHGYTGSTRGLCRLPLILCAVRTLRRCLPHARGSAAPGLRGLPHLVRYHVPPVWLRHCLVLHLPTVHTRRLFWFSLRWFHARFR